MDDCYQVVVLGHANQDIDHIYHWLSIRSLKGAARWYAAFLDAAAALRYEPERSGLSHESERLRTPVRDHFFKTPSGRMYRIVFLIVEKEVRILRVRGPGQPPLRKLAKSE